MRGFMQELSLMVIDEGQQYGTDREIAVISLLQQQPLIIWTGDAEQTPGGIARTAPNTKRSRSWPRNMGSEVHDNTSRQPPSQML